MKSGRIEHGVEHYAVEYSEDHLGRGVQIMSN